MHPSVPLESKTRSSAKKRWRWNDVGCTDWNATNIFIDGPNLRWEKIQTVGYSAVHKWSQALARWSKKSLTFSL